MVRTLGELGHHLELLSFPQGEAVEVPGVVHRRSLRLPVGRVPPGASLAKLLLDVPFTVEAWLRMCFGRYDVVHAVEEAAYAVAPLARLLRLPLVMDVDSSISDQLRYSGFARRGPLPAIAASLERYAARGSAAVITVCASLTDGIRRAAPGAAVFQIEDPPLVDPDAAPDPARVAVLRRELGLSERPVVFYSGNLEPYQGVPWLLEAMERVPEAQLVVMGGEPGEIEALKHRLRDREIEQRCRFAGKRPPTEVATFLALADVVVSPRAKGENTPFKVYTYLAAGKPLVATRIPTHTQLLDDSLAILVEPSPEGIAGGIRDALGDPERASERGRRGQSLIEREYSARRFAEKVARAYAHVAATSNS
jgi:glycosyltransferase involved in cell wall biosynthesis